jgi:betaine-aldehyde dehydrogenase
MEAMSILSSNLPTLPIQHLKYRFVSNSCLMMLSYRKGSFSNYNPATNNVICEVANATTEDVDLAVKAATECLNSSHWGYKSTGFQRAVVLRKMGEIFARRKDDFAVLDSYDMGKPLREALADLGDVITACEHFADLAEQREAHQNEVIENGTGGDFVTKIALEPIGVVGAITPWNYPLLMGIWKIIPALAAGCTIVLKPSELAPLSCLLLGEVCNEAGVPAGAVNIVSGLGADAGTPLASHEGIDKVSFTGSVPTAQKIMALAAAGPRAISLELGGKSPLIVFDDSDIPAAVDWILTGILWGSGQVCSATSRVLVHEAIYEQLLAMLVIKLDGIQILPSLSERARSFAGPTMGPVVSQGQYARVLAYLAAAEQEGLQAVHGPKQQPELKPKLGDGYFIAPHIFRDVPTTSKLWKEEIFGPVLCLRAFSDEAEALHLANDSIYGLAAAVFSADEQRCDRMCAGLRVGIVWKNCCQPAFVQAPWGGMKKSGFGRELGRWGLDEFTSVKQVTSCAPGFQWGLW